MGAPIGGLSPVRKVLVCGDRHWSDYDLVHDTLAALPTTYNPIIIHGAARGADIIAHRVAQHLGMYVMPFLAAWGTHGRAAGPIRNRRMLDEHPDLVIAFHDDLERSRGTKDCVDEARRRGIPVRVVSHPRAEGEAP